jgi:hypothetical protein
MNKSVRMRNTAVFGYDTYLSEPLIQLINLICLTKSLSIRGIKKIKLINGSDILYSLLKLFTGLATAALME